MEPPRVTLPEEPCDDARAHSPPASAFGSKTLLAAPGNDSRHGHGRRMSTPSSATRHRSSTPEPPYEHSASSGSSPTSLRRVLQAQHIYMIAISAVIGAGYYIKTGAILRLGGPAAVVYSFAIVGALAFMVLHGLAHMLRVWPVAGALISFVRAFVDEEIAIVVGLFYWLTYCLSFVGLATTSSDLVEDYNMSLSGRICVTVASLVLPILINLVDIRIFRKVELFMGSLKILIALTVILVMNIINPTVASENNINDQKVGNFTDTGVLFHTETVHGGWFGALFISTLLVAFAYVGVEVVAATAQEAKLDDDIQPDDFPTQDGQVSRESRTCDPFHLPAVLVPVTAMFIYLWGGWIVTQNVEWNDERLPKWIKSNNDDSVFVLSAKQYSPWLGKGLTVLLVINVLSTSSTALFVASRTLFGLTRDLDTRTLDPWLRWLAVFGQKSKYDVPWPAVLASSWLIWVPFLKYLWQNTFETALNIVIEISSVSCIFVWGCESVAAFRLYLCYKRHKNVLDRGLTTFGMLAPIYLPVHKKLWYYVHLFMAGTAACGCGLIVVLGGAFAVAEDRCGIAIFGIFFIILLIFPLLKLWKHGGNVSNWSLGTELGDPERVVEIFQRLESGRTTTPAAETLEDIGWRNLWGAVDRDWFVGKMKAG